MAKVINHWCDKCKTGTKWSVVDGRATCQGCQTGKSLTNLRAPIKRIDPIRKGR